MKKILYVFLCCTLLIFFMPNVKAYEIGDYFTRKQSNLIVQNYIKYGYNNSSYNLNVYKYSYTSNNDAKTFSAYCLDPNQAGTKYVHVQRKFFQTKNDTLNYISDQGEISILRNGYNLQYNRIDANINRDNLSVYVSNDEYYLATSTALRTFNTAVMTFGRSYVTYSGGVWEYNSYLQTGISWAALDYDNWKIIANKYISSDIINNYYTYCVNSIKNDDFYCKKYAIGNSYNDVKGISQIYLPEKHESEYYYAANNNDAGIRVLNAAEIMFLNAIDASAGSTKTADGELHLISENNVSLDKSQTNTNDLSHYNDDSYYYFDVSGFSSNGYIKNILSNNPNVLLYYNDVSLNSDNYKLLSSTDDIVKIGKNASGVVWIKVHSSSTLSGNDCDDDKKFTISYVYNDDSISNMGYVLYANVNLQSTQRYLFEEKGVEQSKSISGTLKACGKCSTNINIPCDCNEDDETSAEANTDESYPVSGSILSPNNVTKCILPQENNSDSGNDEAGNSYHLSEDNGGVSDSNKYCQIYCKEDYSTISLPGIKYVDSGRYFQLKTKITGTKTCYTASNPDYPTKNNSINTNKYIEDIKNDQIRLINDYNNYLKMKTAVEAEIQSNEHGCCCGGSTIDYYVSTTSPYSYGYNIGNDGQLTIYKTSGLSYSFTSAGSCDCDSGCSGTAPNVTCWCNFLGSTPGSASVVDAQRKFDFSTAETELNNAIEQYNLDIKNYSSCSTSLNDANIWQNLFNISNTKITFDYSEPYIDLFSSNQKELIPNCNSEESCMDKDENNNNKNNEYYCTGSINSNYSCESGETSDAQTSTKQYTYCDQSGCKYVSENIPTSNYVKKQKTETATYTNQKALYNVFASGTIVNKETSDSEIIDGLPVSLKTASGTYKFSLIIDNLGQFYNSSKNSNENYGRIIGSENSIAKSQNNSTLRGCDNDYICYYYVNKNKTSIYDKGLQLNFRSISSTNINPNNRTLGYNWTIWDSNTKYGIVGSKAQTTIKEIESSGESVYDQDPILTVNMTPNLASEIRSYNSTQSDTGGYGNDTLTCYDDNTYKNIFCYSQFLDDYSSKYPNAFIFTTTRLGSTENRKTDTAGSGYWTTYSKFTGYTLGNYGGPSWK